MLWCPEVVGYFKSQRHNIKLKTLNMIRFFILLKILSKTSFFSFKLKNAGRSSLLERWSVRLSERIQNLICSSFHRVRSSDSIQKLVRSSSPIIPRVDGFRKAFSSNSSLLARASQGFARANRLLVEMFSAEPVLFAIFECPSLSTIPTHTRGS